MIWNNSFSYFVPLLLGTEFEEECTYFSTKGSTTRTLYMDVKAKSWPIWPKKTKDGSATKIPILCGISRMTRTTPGLKKSMYVGT